MDAPPGSWPAGPVQLRARVACNRELAPAYWLMRLEAPEIAGVIRPGQFIQMRCQAGADPLLPRPMSVCRVAAGQALDVLYEVVGRGTQLLAAQRAGESVSILGPLGNSFSVSGPFEEAVLVGGGIGIAPFVELAAALTRRRTRVRVLMGARTAARVLCAEDFAGLGVPFEAVTEDGSAGRRGVVTEALQQVLAEAPTRERLRVFACGPGAMLRAVARVTQTQGVRCEMSVDPHMPCGLGICFGCAIRVRPALADGPLGQYKLACRQGPIFDAEELQWS